MARRELAEPVGHAKMEYTAILLSVLPPDLESVVPVMAGFLGKMRCDVCDELSGHLVKDTQENLWRWMCIDCYTTTLESIGLPAHPLMLYKYGDFNVPTDLLCFCNISMDGSRSL